MCLQLRAPPAINCANLHRVETSNGPSVIYREKLWHSVCALMIFNFNIYAWLMIWSAGVGLDMGESAKNLRSTLLIASFCAYLWGAGGPVDQIWGVGGSILYSNEVLKCPVIYWCVCLCSQHQFLVLAQDLSSVYLYLSHFKPLGHQGRLVITFLLGHSILLQISNNKTIASFYIPLSQQ